MEEAPRMIHLENISKEYDGATVLSDINLYILKNEFLTLLGPSGCGKTTTLRLIGGFEYPTTGRVIYEGKDITDVPPGIVAILAKSGVCLAELDELIMLEEIVYG